MSNLKSIVSGSPVTQSGGRGYRHKKGCKCPLCKKGGADPTPSDYDSKLDEMEMGNTSNNNINIADDNDYDALDDIESGNSTGKGPGIYKTGGSRKRKNKTKKGTKKRTHKKRKVNRRGRKTKRRKH
jgi:hypothetical protein